MLRVLILIPQFFGVFKGHRRSGQLEKKYEYKRYLRCLLLICYLENNHVVSAWLSKSRSTWTILEFPLLFLKDFHWLASKLMPVGQPWGFLLRAAKDRLAKPGFSGLIDDFLIICAMMFSDGDLILSWAMMIEV